MGLQAATTAAVAGSPVMAATLAVAEGKEGAVVEAAAARDSELSRLCATSVLVTPAQVAR